MLGYESGYWLKIRLAKNQGFTLKLGFHAKNQFSRPKIGYGPKYLVSEFWVFHNFLFGLLLFNFEAQVIWRYKNTNPIKNSLWSETLAGQMGSFLKSPKKLNFQILTQTVTSSETSRVWKIVWIACWLVRIIAKIYETLIFREIYLRKDSQWVK